jgi:hypothetical protein
LKGGNTDLRKVIVSSLMIAIMLVAGVIVIDHNSAPATSQTNGSFSQPQGRRLGFWVSEDDIFEGESIFGNAQGVVPTPQQFYNAYFMTQPYPTTMVFTGGISYGPSTEATWFNQLLAITDQNPNILIWAIFFVNLSGYSIEGAQQVPAPSSGLNSTGFSVERASPLTTFKIDNSAGLSPDTQYTLDMEDINQNLIGAVTTFTTNSTGGWTGTAGLPNTTDAQANAGGYLVVQGTHVGLFIGWQNDQTADFASFMNAIKGHPSFIGALFEEEYFGDTPQIQATFVSIVNGAGYYVLGGTNDPSGGQLVMSYSTYPYFGGSLLTGTAAAGELGVHYGETGGPIPPDEEPIWTSSTVLNIIQNSEVAPITIIIAVNDANNSIGNTYLYMNPTFRSWISNSSYYQSNFLKADGPYITRVSNSGFTATSTLATSTTSSPSVTTASSAEARVVFSSYSQPFTYGTNFQTAGNQFTLQIPTTASINMIAFYLSDRAYDPNPVPFKITGPGVSASGTIPALLEFASQQYYPIQLSQTITLQANTPYNVQFTSLPAGDSYGVAGISQDILTEAAASTGSTYLGLPQWPIFEVGMMNLLPQSDGLAYHNYGGYTDLFSSPGYQGNGEIAMRFLASQNEQLQSFQIFIWSTDGSSKQLTFALRPDVGGHPGTSASSIAIVSLAASEMTAGTFATAIFPTSPQLTAGNYYWIVISSPSGTQPVVFGRLVNPYREYVLYSDDDFASSWGVPADGPTDLGFRITTSGESIVNTVSGSDSNDYFSGIAQSFVPTVSNSVGGAWVSASPAGETMTVSIQSDNGADQPSGTILASGSDQVLTQLYSGSPNVYVGFTQPVTVSPGTKYWLVTTIGPCLSSSCSFPSKAATLTFASDYSLSGFAPPSGTHYETLSGSTWKSVLNGAMPFELVAPASAPIVSSVSTMTTTFVTTTTSSTSCVSTPPYYMCVAPEEQSVGGQVSVAVNGLPASTPYDIYVFNWNTQELANQYGCQGTTSPSGSLSCQILVSSSMLAAGGGQAKDDIVVTDPPSPGGGTGEINYFFTAMPESSVTTTITSTTSMSTYVTSVSTSPASSTHSTTTSSGTTTSTLTTTTSTLTTTTTSTASLASSTSEETSTTTATTSSAPNYTYITTLSTASREPLGFSDSDGYELALGSSGGSTVQGGSTTFTIQVTSDSINSCLVHLYLGPIPFGIVANLEPNSGLTPFTALLTLTSNSSAMPGSYPITVSSVSTAGNYSATYMLSVAKTVTPVDLVSIQVRDIYGSPIPGAKVLLTFADGVSQSKITNGSGVVEFTPAPPGQFTVTVSYMGLTNTMAGNANYSPTLYATMILSYPVALTIGTFGTVVLIALGIRRLKRPTRVTDNWSH